MDKSLPYVQYYYNNGDGTDNHVHRSLFGNYYDVPNPVMWDIFLGRTLHSSENRADPALMWFHIWRNNIIRIGMSCTLVELKYQDTNLDDDKLLTLIEILNHEGMKNKILLAKNFLLLNLGTPLKEIHSSMKFIKKAPINELQGRLDFIAPRHKLVY